MKYYFLLVAFFAFLSTQLLIAQKVASHSFIHKIIEKNGQSFLKDKRIHSVSIGVYKDGETYTQHFGELEPGKGNVPNDSTLYEIGSVTKTMTGHLVAQAVLEGKIKLDDDVRLYLQGDYSNLEFENRSITINDLLTHTSGLPIFLPKEMNSVFEALNPEVPETYYGLEKSYNKEQFLLDLKQVTLTYTPGNKYSYSNAGAELIGHVLETVYQQSIDALLQESFLSEYNMNTTAIRLDETQKQQLVRGYWMKNETRSPNQLNTLWGTGSGMKTTLSDMMRYVKLQLDATNPVVSESHKVLYAEGKLLKVAYFWRYWHDKYGTSYNHHGGTSGTQNWLFVFPKYNLGISIMTNHSGPKTPNRLSKTIKKILKAIVNE